MSDKKGFSDFLEKNPKINIIDLIDHRGYTALHLACFKNLEVIVEYLVERAKDLVP